MAASQLARARRRPRHRRSSPGSSATAPSNGCRPRKPILELPKARRTNYAPVFWESDVNTFRLFAASAMALAAVPLAAASTGSFSPARLSQHVQTLGSDAFEGRAPATRAETKTIAYLSQQFAAAGLQPGGDLVNGKRQWTQAVPLLESEFTAAPQVSINLAGKAMPLTQGEQIAVRAPTNGDKGLAIDGAPLVFVGYGVKAPER